MTAPASRHGYRDGLRRDILTFITGSGSHAGAGGWETGRAPACPPRRARHGSISQRLPRVRARVFALGRRDQIGTAPPSLAGNGQDVGSGGTGTRT